MKYNVYFPTPLEEIADIYDDNMDVCVEFNGRTYTFLIVTIKNLKSSAWLNQKGYVVPSDPFLIVEAFKKDIIEDLLKELFKDVRLLEIYGSDIE